MEQTEISSSLGVRFIGLRYLATEKILTPRGKKAPLQNNKPLQAETIRP
jgi:hypothetical protein